jgi:hypothetical protein
MNVTKSSQTIPLLLLLITLVMMATSADAQTTNGNLDANGMAFLKLNGASDAFALGDIHVAGIVLIPLCWLVIETLDLVSLTAFCQHWATPI